MRKPASCLNIRSIDLQFISSSSKSERIPRSGSDIRTPRMATVAKAAFSVERIVTDLGLFVDSSDLNSLRELWSYLEGKFFCRLPASAAAVVKKYELGLYKFYVLEAGRSARREKLAEFFDKVGPELGGQGEWRDWWRGLMVLHRGMGEAFEESPWSSRAYRDAFFLSLRNFLNVLYHRTWGVAELAPKNQYAVEIMDDFFSIAQPKG